MAAAKRLLEKVERQSALRINPRPWIEENLWIRDKLRQVIPFRLNWAQIDYFEHRTQWDIILKARQLGFTTEISALFFADTLLRPNTTSLLVAHDIDSAKMLFRIVRLFWERLPASEKALVGRPHHDREGELYWPAIGSTYRVGTAGSKRVGHGLTINNLHCSEVSRWTHPEESLTGLLEAVPSGGRVVLESTANGVGNYFHDLWVAAKSRQARYTPHFYVWFENPDYALEGPKLTDLTSEEKTLREQLARMGIKLSDDQIRWRREKIKDLRDRFAEQYPEDDVTCFLTSGRCCFDVKALSVRMGKLREIRGEVLSTIPGKVAATAVAPMKLIVWKRPEAGHRYVIGADVGEGVPGGDPSAACVLDRKSCEQVAELHGSAAPERFARLLDVLGRFYNLATIAVERNNHGHSTLNTLSNVCRYPQLYKHVKYDASQNIVPVLGWPTNQQTKPILVDDLAAAIAGGHIIINSAELIDECLTFVTKENDAQEAQEGKYDDRVLAIGIAWQARKRGGVRPSGERPAGW